MNTRALLPLVIAACSSGSGDDGSIDSTVPIPAALRGVQPSIDRAQFDTSTMIAENPAPAVSVTVTADAARKVYADILTLPQINSSAHFSCPADFGVRYQVVFSGADAELVTASLVPAGCQFVTLTGKSTSAVLDTNPGFWEQMATDLGIPEAQIYPYSPSP